MEEIGLRSPEEYKGWNSRESIKRPVTRRTKGELRFEG